MQIEPNISCDFFHTRSIFKQQCIFPKHIIKLPSSVLDYGNLIIQIFCNIADKKSLGESVADWLALGRIYAI